MIGGRLALLGIEVTIGIVAEHCEGLTIPNVDHPPHKHRLTRRFSLDDFHAKQFAMPAVNPHARIEDGDNSVQSEQMLSALALVLHNTQSTLVHYS